jgi:hypothetical protein
MKFEKGHAKKGGRKKGTPDKKTAVTLEFVKAILSNEQDHVQDMFEKLRTGANANPDAYLKHFGAFMEFYMPKQKRVESVIEIEKGILEVKFARGEE